MSSATLQQYRLHEIIRTLGRVSSLWLDRTHPLRQEAVTALQVSTGFTPRMVEQALDAAFEELIEAKMLQYIESESAFNREPKESLKVLHILAGNVFTAWLPGAVITLLAGGDCTLKPSTQEPVFAGLWKRSVELLDSELGEKIHVMTWQEDLLQQTDAVVAYGSDETLQVLRLKTPTHVHFVGYGHKSSVAVIFKEALIPENRDVLLEQARRDIEPFHLQGCLSPQILFLEGHNPQVFDLLRSEISPLPQIRHFDHVEDLLAQLESTKGHLSALGYAGPDARIHEIRPALEDLEISRICRLGEMQQPPLAWRNGGISLIEALTR